MKQGISFLLLLTLVCSATAAPASDATVSTSWPFFDYRASEAADYSSLNMFGPFVKYESKGIETEYALRPLFYRAVDEEGVSSTDVLYPVLRHKNRGDGTSSVRVLGLLSYDFGESEDNRPGDGADNSEDEAFSSKRYYLFPFLFYGEEEQGRYFAFFPFFGTLYNWFKRDRISFTLFPIYS
ncbi:MAG: hypothetical protein AB1Z50_06690, partial [Desulfuromonadales bacterium]